MFHGQGVGIQWVKGMQERGWASEDRWNHSGMWVPGLMRLAELPGMVLSGLLSQTDWLVFLLNEAEPQGTTSIAVGS